PARRADLGHLLDRDEGEERAGPRAAAALVVKEPEEPVFAVQLDDIPRELVRRVDLRRARGDALARQRAHELADLPLLGAQRIPGHAASLRGPGAEIREPLAHTCGADYYAFPLVQLERTRELPRSLGGPPCELEHLGKVTMGIRARLQRVGRLTEANGLARKPDRLVVLTATRQHLSVHLTPQHLGDDVVGGAERAALQCARARLVQVPQLVRGLTAEDHERR